MGIVWGGAVQWLEHRNEGDPEHALLLRQTLCASMACLIGALAVLNRNKFRTSLCPGPLQPLANAPSKLHAARFLAEQRTQRMARELNAAIRQVLQGRLAGKLCATHCPSAFYPTCITLTLWRLFLMQRRASIWQFDGDLLCGPESEQRG
jgi:hypothetical protein